MFGCLLLGLLCITTVCRLIMIPVLMVWVWGAFLGFAWFSVFGFTLFLWIWVSPVFDLGLLFCFAAFRLYAVDLFLGSVYFVGLCCRFVVLNAYCFECLGC